MTKDRDIADFKFENITDTGTEGTEVASVSSTGAFTSTTIDDAITAVKLKYPKPKA